MKSGPNGVRLSGGAYRGRVLAVPAGARPSEGRVREALFSIWSDRLPGARVLDLFAGSGAVAIEAVGRGALSAVAIEGDAHALTVLKANVEKVVQGGERSVEVRRATLPSGFERALFAGEVFDLVFVDPPYRFDAYPGLLAVVAPRLAADGEIVVEHSSRIELPHEVADLVRADGRRYGETALAFYRRAPR